MKRQSDDFEEVVVSVYGPENSTRRNALQGGIGRCGINLQESPQLICGDFNVTLEAMDRPNDTGGQDPDSEDFWAFILEAALQEMGLVDYLYTWRSTKGRNMPSWLDRFLCSME